MVPKATANAVCSRASDPQLFLCAGILAKQRVISIVASKVCGGRTGVAKQTKVISVMHAESPESVPSGLNVVLTDINSRQSKGQALPGRTILSMSFAVEARYISKKQRAYMQSLLQAIMNKGVICVCDAGNAAKTEGFPRTGCPAALASSTFLLIPVGAVDITGQVADFSQEGIVYTVGINSPCAGYDDYRMEDNADGTSGAELLKDQTELTQRRCYANLNNVE